MEISWLNLTWLIQINKAPLAKRRVKPFLKLGFENLEKRKRMTKVLNCFTKTLTLVKVNSNLVTVINKHKTYN